MSQWEITRRQVAISGKVTDGATGRPLAGARVSVVGATTTLELSVAPDGHFHALDLKNGSYRVDASMPGGGYVAGSKQVTVSRTDEGKIRMAVADMQLSRIN